jgi:hypothetical protein
MMCRQAGYGLSLTSVFIVKGVPEALVPVLPALAKGFVKKGLEL